MTATWLVIACPQAHADLLAHCLGSLQHDPARTIVCTSIHHDELTTIPNGVDLFAADDGKDFSLPRLWNHGISWAYELGATHVAVFASDVTGHPGSIPALAAAITNNGWAMAGPTSINGGNTRTLPPTRTCRDRVPGACFMLDASHRLLCDERYRWWFGDDDLEMRARECGPVGVVDGTGLALSRPDTGLSTPEREQWAVEDRARFVGEWGCEPW